MTSFPTKYKSFRMHGTTAHGIWYLDWPRVIGGNFFTCRTSLSTGARHCHYKRYQISDIVSAHRDQCKGGVFWCGKCIGPTATRRTTHKICPNSWALLRNWFYDPFYCSLYAFSWVEFQHLPYIRQSDWLGHGNLTWTRMPTVIPRDMQASWCGRFYYGSAWQCLAPRSCSKDSDLQ